jgi:hypothetical protein
MNYRKFQDLTPKELETIPEDELFDIIIAQYGERISNDEFLDYETLMNAIERCEKKDKERMYPYATGYSFRCNALKFLIFDAIYHYPHEVFTLKQICEFRNLPRDKVKSIVSRWKKRGYPYLSELPKRLAHNEIRYKARKALYVYHRKYLNALVKGFELNFKIKRRHRLPRPDGVKYDSAIRALRRVDSYARINSWGREMGLKQEDVPDLKAVVADKIARLEAKRARLR